MSHLPRDLGFTCLLPFYQGDDPGYFAAAVESLSASTVPPSEIILCQDGDVPMDLERVVLESARRLPARIVRNPGPPGLHHNLNHAAREVRTPWIARFDADDLNAPDRFDGQIAFLRANPQVGVLGGNIREFWPDGARQRRIVPKTHDDIVRMARWRSPMNHMTTMFATQVFLNCGGYPDIPRKEDYGLWLNMIGAGVIFANLAQDLVHARLGGDFYARRAGLRNVATEWQIAALKREIGMGVVIPALAFMARSSALALHGPAELIYRRMRRRSAAVSARA